MTIGGFIKGTSMEDPLSMEVLNIFGKRELHVNHVFFFAFSEKIGVASKPSDQNLGRKKGLFNGLKLVLLVFCI